MKRILGLLGWLGVVLVMAALALRFTKPDLNLHPKLALAGLVVTAIYALSQWRDIGRSFQGRNVKYGSFAARQRRRVRRDSRRSSTGSRTGRTSAGT